LAYFDIDDYSFSDMFCINYFMNTNKQKKIIKNYFKFFNEKNTLKLASLFANNVILKDWNIDVTGKKKVIIANKKIFDLNPNIKVKIKKVFFVEKNIFAILDINLNSKKKIKVVDHITLNRSNLITKIRAYLG